MLVDAAVTGLSPSTTYYFRVCSSNSKGEDKSSIANFTTSSLGPDLPVTVTVAASSVGAATATLNGNVTPNGLATEAWFEYGTSSTLSGATGTTHEAIGDGTVSVAVDAALTGLTPGTTYYYRVVAGNSSGKTSGTILSFTPGGAPAVANLAATEVGATTATLNGSVTPNGLATQAWFEYGTSSTLSGAASTPHESIGAGSETVAVDAALTGLITGTTYYYRVVASNSTGTASGSPILSFTVGAAPTVAYACRELRRRDRGGPEQSRLHQRTGDGGMVRVGNESDPRRGHQRGARVDRFRFRQGGGQQNIDGLDHRDDILLPGCGQQQHRDEQWRHNAFHHRRVGVDFNGIDGGPAPAGPGTRRRFSATEKS